MEDQAQGDNNSERHGASEPRETGVRTRLRELFAPTDTGDAVADMIATHGRELELRSEELLTAVHDLERREEQARALHTQVERILREGSAELDVRQEELTALAAELDRRATELAVAEQRVADRSRELGAVELRRAAVERREESIRARTVELERQAAELAALAAQPEESDSAADTSAVDTPAVEDEHVVLLFAGTYRLVEREGAPPLPGEHVALEDGDYRCLRLTRSPFPDDARRCALLEPLRDATAPAAGSGTEGA